MATILKDKIVKIRKEQRCYSCYRKFPKDTLLKSWTAVYEGQIGSGYTCPVCEKIMSLSNDSEFEEGYVCDMLNKGQTPEQLLEEMQTPTKVQEMLKQYKTTL